MKKLVNLVESNETALESLAGEVVTFYCVNYFYSGKLVGINDTCVELENPRVIFDTGSYKEKNWKVAEKLPNNIFVQLSAVEMFGIVK